MSTYKSKCISTLVCHLVDMHHHLVGILVDMVHQLGWKKSSRGSCNQITEVLINKRLIHSLLFISMATISASTSTNTAESPSF